MTKNRMIYFFLILNFAVTGVYGWGDQGHRLISKHAMNNLPIEMSAFKVWADTISALAPDPDKRRKYDSTEYSKHFIDIDFYEEFNSYKMERNSNLLKEKYSDSVVVRMGILPWNTITYYKTLVETMRAKNRDKTIKLMADLSHYIADAHNPMHTILDYDGALTNQKGLHSRYESKMFKSYYDEIVIGLKNVNPQKLPNIENYVWDYILASHYNHQLLFISDIEAVKVDSTYGEKYYGILWYRTKFLTLQFLNNASEVIVSIFFAAWIEAGKPALNDFY